MTEALWPLFLVASVVVIATPGQDMILVMSKSLAHGTRTGVATAVGVSVGLVGHTLLATLGLGAVLRTSEWLFTALKFLGAAYLLYLGARLLLTRAAALNAATPQPQSTARLFVTGGLSNISNPKIAVFYFAFSSAVCVSKGSPSHADHLRTWHRLRGSAFVMVPVAAQGACLALPFQWGRHDWAGRAPRAVPPK